MVDRKRVRHISILYKNWYILLLWAVDFWPLRSSKPNLHTWIRPDLGDCILLPPRLGALLFVTYYNPQFHLALVLSCSVMADSFRPWIVAQQASRARCHLPLPGGLPDLVVKPTVLQLLHGRHRLYLYVLPVRVLHAICQQIWKTQQWPQDWKRSVFIPIPKKGNAKECSNYRTIALISHASKVILKILQTSTVCEPRTSRCSSWI